MVRTRPVEEESPGWGMVWVGEFGKDFVEGLPWSWLRPSERKEARFLGKLAMRSREGEGRKGRVL